MNYKDNEWLELVDGTKYTSNKILNFKPELPEGKWPFNKSNLVSEKALASMVANII